MSDQIFVSYAQNHEDVVLWRALGHVPNGTYVDIGAYDATEDSVTKALYDRGWSGINVEALPDRAEAIARERPRDITAQVAITSQHVEHITIHEFRDTGWSTLVNEVADVHRSAGHPFHDLQVPAKGLTALLDEHGYLERDVHILKVDVEGAEADVLSSVDFKVWRPWVLVIEATKPNSTEASYNDWEQQLLDADYQFCLFDGLSRYYVAGEHAASLGSALSVPAGVLDDFVSHTVDRIQRELEVTRRELDLVRRDALRWRGAALHTWVQNVGMRAAQERIRQLAEEVAGAHHANHGLLTEYERLQNEATGAHQMIHLLQGEVTRLTWEASGAHTAIANFKTELTHVYASRSWRLTRIMRRGSAPGERQGAE